MHHITSLFPTILLLFFSSPPTLASPLNGPVPIPLNTTTTTTTLPPLNSTTAFCIPGPSPPLFTTSCEDALLDFLLTYMPGPATTLYDFGTSFPLIPHRGNMHRVKLPAKSPKGNCEFRIEAVRRGQHGVMDRATVGGKGWLLWRGCVSGGRYAGGKWDVDEGVRFVFGVLAQEEEDGSAGSVATE